MPVYIQIADELRLNIEQGIYQAGDKLPTEVKLSERFGVNRHTLRQAIALLRTEGLVRVEQGRGTFVAESPIRYAIGKRVRYNKALTAHGRKASFKILRAVELPSDTAIATALNLSLGDPVALVERLGSADDAPISITRSYFPLNLFPDLLAPEQIALLSSLGSISQFLRQLYDCDHLRRSTCVSARAVEEASDARLLALPLNQPILVAESINVDQHGRSIEYGVTRFRGDRMELFFENELSPDLPQSLS